MKEIVNTMGKTLITLAAAGMLLGACSDFHTSDNGVLDGLWQLTNVDSLQSGHSADVKDTNVFWAVQADLLEVRDITYRHAHVLFRFKREADRLILSDPIVNDRLISDSIVTDVSTISYYGFSSLTESFQVLRLDGSHMTLQSECLRMYFRKY